MSTERNQSFMPPDEPTAVYPIGASAAALKASVATSEPPEPPELIPETAAEAAPKSASGFNPKIAAALIAIPLAIALGTILLTGIILTLI